MKGRKRLSGAKYLVKEGDLVVTNLNYNDTGQYTCAAKNILGSSEASGSLTVRSKKNIFFSYGKQPFKQGLLQANLAFLMATGPCFMARLSLKKKMSQRFSSVCVCVIECDTS